MAPRPNWKGFLRLSLVTVPVRGYTATTTGNEVRLNQLHAGCNTRIKYQKACPEHGEVGKDDIVSGYEYAKGQYVVVDLDEMRKLRPESDNTIRLDGFVQPDTIDPIYHAGRTYHLLPDGAVGQKPYALLLRSMTDHDVHGIGQVVLSNREQLVLLRPMQGVLSMVVLTPRARVKLPQEFLDEVEEQELAPEELALTRTLIDATRIEEFDFGRYEDTYAARLTKLIQAKVDGEEIVEVRDAEEPKILNLMEALKRSVAQSG